ncbi:MAG TPA: FG-GAP repeat protein [Terriglobales bacterium]
MRRTYLYCAFILAAVAAAGLMAFRGNALAALKESFKAGGLRSFEIVPLETVSETSSNASIGDLNGDGYPDVGQRVRRSPELTHVCSPDLTHPKERAHSW